MSWSNRILVLVTRATEFGDEDPLYKADVLELAWEGQIFSVSDFRNDVDCHMVEQLVVPHAAHLRRPVKDRLIESGTVVVVVFEVVNQAPVCGLSGMCIPEVLSLQIILQDGLAVLTSGSGHA